MLLKMILVLPLLMQNELASHQAKYSICGVGLLLSGVIAILKIYTHSYFNRQVHLIAKWSHYTIFSIFLIEMLAIVFKINFLKSLLALFFLLPAIPYVLNDLRARRIKATLRKWKNQEPLDSDDTHRFLIRVIQLTHLSNEEEVSAEMLSLLFSHRINCEQEECLCDKFESVFIDEKRPIMMKYGKNRTINLQGIGTENESMMSEAEDSDGEEENKQGQHQPEAMSFKPGEEHK